MMTTTTTSSSPSRRRDRRCPRSRRRSRRGRAGIPSRRRRRAAASRTTAATRRRRGAAGRRRRAPPRRISSEDTPRFSDDGRRGPSIGSATRCSPAPRASQGSETLPPSPSNVEAAAPSQEETQAYQQPPERFEYTRPVNVARGQALPGEYTFDEEAESIDDDGDDDDLDPHPHRRLPPAAGSLNSLAAQSQAEDTPRPPRPRAADPGEPSLPWQPAKGLKGFSLGELARVAGRRAAGRAADGGRFIERRVRRRRRRVRHVRGDGGAAARAGAGADGLELAPRVGLPVDGAARGPGMRNRPMGSFRPPRPVGKRKCTKVLYDWARLARTQQQNPSRFRITAYATHSMAHANSNYPASPARFPSRP